MTHEDETDPFDVGINCCPYCGGPTSAPPERLCLDELCEGNVIDDSDDPFIYPSSQHDKS